MIYYKCESSILDMLGNGRVVEVRRESTSRMLGGSKGDNGKLEVELMVELNRGDPFRQVTPRWRRPPSGVLYHSSCSLFQ